MLYWLLYEQLFHYFTPLRLFSYVTFRTAFASLTALFISIVFGPWMIRKLQEFQIGQHIREEGPKSHQKKAGTPTMGGVLIIVSIIVPTLLNYMGSALVIDPKGENAAITARARQSKYGADSPVHIINPWGELGATFANLGFPPATFNPLDALDRNDPGVVAMAQDMAATISPTSGGSDEFWKGSAAGIQVPGVYPACAWRAAVRGSVARSCRSRRGAARRWCRLDRHRPDRCTRPTGQR